MKYINQKENPHILYVCNTDDPADEQMHRSSFDMTGCGPCCAVMVADRLLVEPVFDIKAALQMIYACGANHKKGTDYHLFAPYFAEKMGLRLQMTSNMKELKACLQTGGCAVANSGGDHDGHIGVFTHGGHYVCVISVDSDGMYAILDPSLVPGKFEEPGRVGKVNVKGSICYCTGDVLLRDCDDRVPAFYCFWRK